MTPRKLMKLSVLVAAMGIALGLVVSWTTRPQAAGTLAAPVLTEDAADAAGAGGGGVRLDAPAQSQPADGEIEAWQEDPGLQAADEEEPDEEESDAEEPADEPEDEPEGEPQPDFDGDGSPDDADNCPKTPNPAQNDTDDDGYGNACDDDDDNDGLTDEEEAKLGTDPHDDDTDGDGWQDGLEVQEGTNPNSPFSNPDQIDEIQNP